MGCCKPGRLCGPDLELDEDLKPVCDLLNMTVMDAMKIYEKFKEIDEDMSGVVDLDEFFEFLREERTDFATQLFTLIDENASGEIDFNEFLVGLWNICTFEEDSLLRFAFDLVDKDNSGYIDGDEMEDLIKNVHGTKYNKMLFAHTKKVMKKYDKNGDNQFSFEEFKGTHRELPLLFMPAFTLMYKMKEEFYGPDFWALAGKARARQKKAQRIRDFMRLNAQLQKIAPDKYSGDQIAAAVMRAQKKPKKPIHEATYDTNRVRVDGLDQPRQRGKTRNERLEDEHQAHDKSGFKRFSLNERDRLGLDDDLPPERTDKKRSYGKESYQGIATVGPSEEDRRIADEVARQRAERNRRGSEGKAVPKQAKAMTGPGKKVANPLNKSRRNTQNPNQKSRRTSATIVPR